MTRHEEGGYEADITAAMARVAAPAAQRHGSGSGGGRRSGRTVADRAR